MKWLDNCLLTLAVIGCIVWGLIGFFQFNLIFFSYLLSSDITYRDYLNGKRENCQITGIGCFFRAFRI